MPTPLDNYFQRVNPSLKRPEEGASRLPSIDLYGAFDRLSRQLFSTAPTQLDRTRTNRNKFLAAVK